MLFWMAAKPKAVFLDAATLGPGVDASVLEALVDVQYFPYTAVPEITERLEGAQVAIVNKTRISRETLQAASSLRLIVVTATGTDNVDTSAAKDLGIVVSNIRGYCNDSVVQHVFALILSLTQHTHEFAGLVKSGAWQKAKTFTLFEFPMRELRGRRLGIVGCGSLGRAVGKLGACLGMRLPVSARPGASSGKLPAGRTALPNLLAEADVVRLHCPLTGGTNRLLARAEFEAMKRDAVVMNTARGGLIDGADLVDALKRGEIAGAGIDVLAEEPPRGGDPLLAADLPNLIVTPHIAWAAQEARQRALDQAVENIEDFFRGGFLRRVV
jgi:glycerate dehydrogenase